MSEPQDAVIFEGQSEEEVDELFSKWAKGSSYNVCATQTVVSESEFILIAYIDKTEVR